jgi:hypothetical protein
VIFRDSCPGVLFCLVLGIEPTASIARQELHSQLFCLGFVFVFVFVRELGLPNFAWADLELEILLPLPPESLGLRMCATTQLFL